MKKWLLGILVLVLVGGGIAAWTQRTTIALRVLERGAAQAIGAPAIEGLGEGLHVGFCGTGSPLPDRSRAGPCTAVVADGRLFVFDAGEGSSETLSLMGLPPARIEAVFLTHFHSDHIDGLGPMALQHWAGGAAAAPLALYGPSGVERIAAGFNEAYALDSGYRVAHHGADVVPPSGFGLTAHAFAAIPLDGEALVYEQGGVRVIAFAVDHGPVAPAVGYRVEYGGRKVVISGDTALCACVGRAAHGADLLVHEALSPRLTRVMGTAAASQGDAHLAQIFHDIENYHTTPSQVATLATEASVRAVALTHITPSLPIPFLEGAFLGGAEKAFNGPFWMMRDGDMISISPTGTLTRRSLLMRR
jgi:ribonuclease Z